MNTYIQQFDSWHYQIKTRWINDESEIAKTTYINNNVKIYIFYILYFKQ